MEACRIVRSWESHIFYTLSSQMVVSFLVLHAGQAPPHSPPKKDSWYSFLLEAESTQGRSAAERIGKLENPMASGTKPTIFQLIA
jgi:hypothetical protein